MQKSGFNSRQITGKTEQRLENVTSLTISNYGGSIATVSINGVTRNVPAFNPDIQVPFGAFNIPGDGTACDLEITIDFVGGTGLAILDYRTAKDC